MTSAPNIEQTAAALRDADAVVIGASNGLSIAEGYHIFANNEWFRQNFGDFQQRYGIHSPLEGITFPYPTPEEKWAFLSRLATLVSYTNPPSATMENLRSMTAGKDTFVLTTNGEDHFVPAGFAPAAVFETEGTLTKNRCARHCTDELFDNRESMLTMAAAQSDCRVPSELLPRCPRCGGPMEVNMGKGPQFFQMPSWQEKAHAFREFCARNHNKRIVILELGVGWRNQLVKGPLYQLSAAEPNLTYTVFNMSELLLPPRLQGRGILLEGDIAQTVSSVEVTLHSR